MKKIKLLTVFLGVATFSAPAFSIAQIGVQGNYVNDTFSDGNKYGGVGAGGFARFTAGIPLLITFAAGPYVDYSNLTGGPSAAPNTKQIRVGGEIAIYADVLEKLLVVTPYARLGFGYEGNTRSSTYTTTTTPAATVSADAFYYGTSGHTLFGLTYKVAPLIYIFAEGGVQWSTLTASVPDSVKAAGISVPDLTTTGWRASVGAMVWL